MVKMTVMIPEEIYEYIRKRVYLERSSQGKIIAEAIMEFRKKEEQEENGK